MRSGSRLLRKPDARFRSTSRTTARFDPMFGTRRFRRDGGRVRASSAEVLVGPRAHQFRQHPGSTQPARPAENDKADWSCGATPTGRHAAEQRISIVGGRPGVDTCREQYYLRISREPARSELPLPRGCRTRCSTGALLFQRGADGFAWTRHFYTQTGSCATTAAQSTDRPAPYTQQPVFAQQHLYDIRGRRTALPSRGCARSRSIPRQRAARRVADDQPYRTLADSPPQPRAANGLRVPVLDHECSAPLRDVLAGIRARGESGGRVLSIGNHDVERVVHRWKHSADTTAARRTGATFLMALRARCLYQAGAGLGRRPAVRAATRSVRIEMVAAGQGRDGCRRNAMEPLPRAQPGRPGADRRRTPTARGEPQVATAIDATASTCP